MTATPLLLVGVFLYGVPLALSLDPRLRGATLAGASFLLGAGAAGLHLFVLSAVYVPWTRTSVVLSMIPLFALALFIAKRRAWAPPPPPGGGGRTPRPTFVDAITIAFVVAYAIFAIWAPPFEWDFYGIWGLKARWFFEARGIEWATLLPVGKPDYPVLVPLLFDFVAVVTGEWNDRAFGWIFVGLCASVLAIARGMFADEVKRPALATLAIAFPTLNLWIGLAEAGVMAFGCAGLLFIRSGSIHLGAIFLGLAAWSKNEGLAWIVTAAVALFIATRSIRKVLALWPAAALIAPWLIARSLLDLPTDLAQGAAVKRVLEHLADPAGTFRALWSATPDQPYFWLAVAATLAIFARTAVRSERFLLSAVVLQTLALVTPLLATPFDLASHASFSLNRIPHQLAPAAGFLAVVVLMRNRSVVRYADSTGATPGSPG